MKAVNQILNDQINKGKTPGLQYYFFNKNTITYSYLGGMADIANQKPVTEESTFNANSTTKTFTSLSVLQLVEKGLLSLDDTVSKYLPSIPYPPSITIKQLLTHSSGIPNPIPLKWVHLASEHSSFDHKTFFEEILRKYNKVKSEPNEKFSYSNLGYVILGILIEKVSGQAYVDYVSKNIIKTIGLEPEDLGFEISNADIHSKGYQKKWSFMNFILGFLFDKSKFVDKTEGKWISGNSLYVNGAPYGGLIVSAKGFVTYIQEMLRPDNRLISDEFKKLLFTENILANGKPSKMCLSWFKGELNGHSFYTHAGGGAFFYCEIRIYPELGKGSVIMFNRTGMKDERFLNNIDKYLIDQSG